MSTLEPVRPLSPAEVSWKTAQRIANTPFVPGAFRGKPESVFAAVLFGEEMGLGPMQSLTQIHVIEGKPSIAPELMRALVFKAGHRIDIKLASETKAVLYGKRSDSGSEATVEWTMQDAQRAGLAGRGAWKTYPRAMLMARATSELCRMLFPDVVAGLSYTPEEVASVAGVEWTEAPSETVATGTPAIAAVVASVPVEVTPEPEQPPVYEPEIDWTAQDDFPGSEIVDAEIVEKPARTPLGSAAAGEITEKQVKLINVLFTKARITERPDKADLCTMLAGRQIASTSDLTKREATVVIDHLKTVVGEA